MFFLTFLMNYKGITLTFSHKKIHYEKIIMLVFTAD